MVLAGGVLAFQSDVSQGGDGGGEHQSAAHPDAIHNCETEEAAVRVLAAVPAELFVSPRYLLESPPVSPASPAPCPVPQICDPTTPPVHIAALVLKPIQMGMLELLPAHTAILDAARTHPSS